MGQPTDAERKAVSDFIYDSLAKIAAPYMDRPRPRLPTPDELAAMFSGPITFTLQITSEPVDVGEET